MLMGQLIFNYSNMQDMVARSASSHYIFLSIQGVGWSVRISTNMEIKTLIK